MKDVPVSPGRTSCRFTTVVRTSFTCFAILVASVALLSPSPAKAVPYATALTNATGTISFRLNESADVVKIISNGGATINELGALPAGLHTFALGISGTFQVSVFKSSPAGFTTPVGPNRGAILQISTNTVETRFNSPRGLAVNSDPASPYFGRVYVANGSSGNAASNTFGPARSVGDGIYMLNADFTDATGQGNTALNGGLNFTIGLDVSPYRLSIGKDNNLYISEWGDTNGTLYVVDPNVSAGSGANVLGGPTGSPFPVGLTRYHGSIAAAVVEGSLTGGDLVAYVIDEDLQNDRASTTQNMRNSLWRHDIGAALPGPEVLPTRIGTATPWINFASQTMDMSRGPNGYFYVNDYRSTGNDRGGLYVVGADGTQLWNSLAASRELLSDATANDLLRATGGGAVSPRGDFAAVINLETNGITVVPLTNGIPNIANRLVFHGFGIASGQGREVAFDAAGNLYAVSSAAQAMRVFSPGGTTTAITGSDGTFELIRPPGVSVVATDASASEAGDTGTFTLTREGDTSAELTVFYTLTGTAENGTDYETNVLSAVIPAGASSVDVLMTPIDDLVAEFQETITLTVTGTAIYDIKPPVVATVTISDNERALINITALDSNAYERLPGDKLVFQFERLGATDLELIVAFTVDGGTAVPDGDFTVPGFQPPNRAIIILEPGDVRKTLTVDVLDDAETEGDQTVVFTVVPDFDEYSPGPISTATGIIVDNELPPGVILFSDNFDTDSSANWTVRFGANNDIYDANVRWAFDYSTLSPAVPPAPNSPGTTLGLFLQLNRTNATANGSAGINLYPGRTFSGNFALRADMYVSYNNDLAGTTEFALLGLNHSGQFTNRITITTGDTNKNSLGGDGVWTTLGTDGADSLNWAAFYATNASTLPRQYTNKNAGSVAGLISAPPYAVAGAIGNRSTSTTKTWAEVELGQNNNVVTLKVNNSVIFSFPNPSGFTSGDIMIGHDDPADSIGSLANFVIFDNVRVVTFDARITSVQLLPVNQVQIDFVGVGVASDFHLDSTPNVSPATWNEETSAVISTLPQGFRFTVARSGDTRFYRIRH